VLWSVSKAFCKDLPTESLDLDEISAKLIKRVQRMFNIKGWGRYGQFGLLLALAGIPVTRDSVVDVAMPARPQQQARGDPGRRTQLQRRHQGADQQEALPGRPIPH
jgi:hypothetical protein